VLLDPDMRRSRRASAMDHGFGATPSGFRLWLNSIASGLDDTAKNGTSSRHSSALPKQPNG
jgi:hypothetical protein